MMLSNINELVQYLRELAQYHAHPGTPGVTKKHWTSFSQALLWAIEKALKDKWDKDMCVAWTQTLSTIRMVMEPVMAATVPPETKAESPEKGGQETQGKEERVKQLVQASWRLVAQDIEGHGVKFFMRIFEIAPPALQLFSFRDVADLEKSPQLKAHASVVMRTVGEAVAGLSDVQSLIPVLQNLGAGHAKYGVQPEHFPIVGQALLWTLEQGLGGAGAWTPEVKDAWTKTYATVQSVMEPALAAEIQKSGEKKAAAEAAASASAPVVASSQSLVSGFPPSSSPSVGTSQSSRLDSSGVSSRASASPALSKEERAKVMKQLVQQSWSSVAPMADSLGVVFFRNIFSISPSLIELFPFKGSRDDLEKDQRFVMHASDVMRTVGHAVVGLSDVKKLLPILKALGYRHAGYGVKSSHFPVICKALIMTMEGALKEKWNPEVKEAWKKTVATIQSVMEPAITDATKNPMLQTKTPRAPLGGVAAPLLPSGSDLNASRGTSASPSQPPKSVATPKSATTTSTSSPGGGEAGDHAVQASVAASPPAVSVEASTTPQSNGGSQKQQSPMVVDKGAQDSDEDIVDMSEDEVKALVITTWDQVSDDPEDFGMKLFMRMFKILPKALKLFSFRDEDAIGRIVKLKKHAVLVMSAITKVVENLDKVHVIVPYLKGIGRQHAGYQVEPEYYETFGTALFLTLQHELKNEWSNKVRHAWHRAYTDVQEILMEGTEEGKESISNGQPVTGPEAAAPQ